MRAVRSDGDGGVALVDADLTTPEYATDPVRVRVRSAGICGSDLKMLRWNLRVTLGHEFAGLLDDDTPVCVQPNAPCGKCERCVSGYDQLCVTSSSRVSGVFSDGGLADEVIVDRKDAIPLPTNVGVDIGALVEPIAVGVHAAHAAGLHDGAPPDRVLIVGGGSIGLATVGVVRHHAVAVDLIARYPAQREAGERLGAGFALADEYDVVIECAGSQSSLDDAIARVRPRGTIVVAATWFDPVQVGVSMLMKEAHLVPAYCYGRHHGVREFDEAAEILGANPELAGTLISHRFGLDDAPEAFRIAADRAAGAIKVVVEP